MASAAKSEITIYAPGLLGPFNGQKHWQVCDWPNLPLLQKLLSRAERVKNDTALLDDYQRLFHYFNLDSSNAVLPLAALSLLAEGVDPEGDCWMRLDPVCLHADRVDAILLAHDELMLTDTEADTLQDSIRPLLDEWSVSLKRTSPHDWYIRLSERIFLATTPITQVKGQAITHVMPTGDEYIKWHRLINEVQMLWHSHPVNLQREQRGQLMATSVWPWGCGVLPAKSNTSFQKVYSDDLVVCGLARLNDIECSPLSDPGKNKSSGQVLVVDFSWRQYQRDNDVTAWFKALEHWQTTVLETIKNQLEQDKSLQITFDFGGDAIYKIKRQQLRRWWRKTCSFQTLMHQTT